MGDEMKNLNQQILNFDFEQNFKDQDFYVSKSNEYSFKLLNDWPKWEKNFVNLIGENFSGKSHLINIFLQNFRGITCVFVFQCGRTINIICESFYGL